ncbi:MAG: hypothetical protein V4629_05265, partial [Pseudomonadota bacterium]
MNPLIEAHGSVIRFDSKCLVEVRQNGFKNYPKTKKHFCLTHKSYLFISSIKNILIKAIAFLIALILVACETPAPVSPYTKERVQEEIRQAAERTKELETQEKENTQVLDDLQNDVFSEISFRSKKNSRPRFDVNVENMEVRDFFVSLTQDSDLNIVVHPDITGKITLSLKNVLMDEVMDVASRVYG